MNKRTVDSGNKSTFSYNTRENAYESYTYLIRMCDIIGDDFISVYDAYTILGIPNCNIAMKQVGWDKDGLMHANIYREVDGFILELPAPRPIEEFKRNKEMNKQTMDLKTQLVTNTSTATINWGGSTYNLENVSGTLEQSWGCPSTITITGNTIGIAEYYANKTDYTSFFMNGRGYCCEDNAKKMEDKMNTVAKRNGKAVDAAMNFKKIEVYNDRVVKITFADGTYTKAVCSDKDEFCLDTGIMVCVMKKLFGGQKEGTKLIASMLNNAHAQIEKQEYEKLVEEERRFADEQKKRKAELKKAAKAMKAKEEAIDIQKQAYIRAMQEMGMTKDE